MLPAWFFWTVVTLIAWGIWAILSKVLGDRLSAIDAQVLSACGFVPVLMLSLILVRYESPLIMENGRTRRRGITYSIAAGLLSALGNLPFYRLLQGGEKASTAIAITALAPLVTVLLAVSLLRERINRIQAMGLCCALAAIYLFNVGNERGWLSQWMLLAGAPLICWGTAGFLQKLATQSISGSRSAFWFLLAFPLFTLMCLMGYVPDLTLSAWEWVLVTSLGFTLALGNLTVLLAFASGGKATIVAPMCGLYPLVSAPLAIGLLGESIRLREWAGIALATAAVVAIACETQHDLQIATNIDAES